MVKNIYSLFVHEAIKYVCDQDNKQFTTKGSLAGHKRAVHEGVKYHCGRQATTNSDLTEHKRAVHEGVKYPCGQCGYQATKKGDPYCS